MRIVRRYLMTQILHMIFLVGVVFFALEFFILLMNEFSHIGHGDYHLLAALQFIVLRMPSEFNALFPIVCLLGCLLSLSLLANQSELVVLRAAGFSLWDMSAVILRTVAWLSLVVMLWGELLAPWMMHHAFNLKAASTSKGQAIRNREGAWFKQGRRFIHVHAVLSPTALAGVDIFTFDAAGHLQLARHANSAKYQNHRWRLSQVADTEFKRQQLIGRLHKAQDSVLDLKPTFLQTLSLTPRELNLYRLWRQARSARPGAPEYALAFWQRSMRPILILVLMLSSLPFIFTAQAKSSLGARLLIGLGVGFSYYSLQRILGPLSLVYHWPPVFAAVIPIGLLSLCGLLLYYRNVKNA